jgi:8-oxo-dGTP pyrophosphatase MutT (NUDIX family)
MMPPDFVDALRQRLQRPLPGLDAQMRLAPRPRTAVHPSETLSDLRPAAALILLYRHDGVWCVPLTVRGASLRQHGGQVSLPGGRIEPGETPEQTAVREAFEEIGVRPGNIDVLGRLTPLPILVSGHLLHPVVGVTSTRPPFIIGEHEVERIIEASLPRLRGAGAIAWETRERLLPPLGSMEVPFFEVDGARVWGATAMVLSELLAILDSVDAVPEPHQ